MVLNVSKSEFIDAVHLRYNWQITDVANVCVCGEPFNIDHAAFDARLGIHARGFWSRQGSTFFI